MSTAGSPPQLDLTAFFEAWTQSAGRMLDFQEPTVNALPLPPPDAGAIALRAPGAACELRFGARDIPILAGCLRFKDDEDIRSRMAAAATAGDIKVVVEFLKEHVPGAGKVSLAPVSNSPGASSKLSFEVAGFEVSDLFLVALDEEQLADPLATMALPAVEAPAEADVMAEAAAVVDDPAATQIHEPMVVGASVLQSTVAPPSAPSLGGSASGGRLTALIVDTIEERELELIEALRAKGWRILDQKAPRSILNWALTERVVDVIVLDGDWPHAAILRQNLGSDGGTSSLPVLSPGPQPAELLAAMESAANEKRLSD